jgi:hypothetical protein
MHLIQPINISGTPMCVKTWRTDSVRSGDMALVGVEANDAWQMEGGLGYSLEGSVVFGTSCISYFILTTNYDKDSPATGAIEVYRNGLLVLQREIVSNRSTEDINPNTGLPYNSPFVDTFDLTSDRPCGDVWVLSARNPTSNNGHHFIRFQISGVM